MPRCHAMIPSRALRRVAEGIHGLVNFGVLGLWGASAQPSPVPSGSPAFRAGNAKSTDLYRLPALQFYRSCRNFLALQRIQSRPRPRRRPRTTLTSTSIDPSLPSPTPTDSPSGSRIRPLQTRRRTNREQAPRPDMSGETMATKAPQITALTATNEAARGRSPWW
jgi:hypothetical protein